MHEKRALAGLVLLLAAASWLSVFSGRAASADVSPARGQRPPAASPGQPAQPAPPASAPDTTKQSAEDAAITGKVKAALMADPDLKTQAINVDTVNATVTLSGIVESTAKSEAARVVTARVDGVKSVDNRLTVKGTTAALNTAGRTA